MRIEFLLTHSKSWRKKPYVSASQAASTKKATMETQIVLPRKNIPITNLKKVAKAEDMLPRLLLIMLEPTILMLPMLTLMLAWLLLWWVQPMRPRQPAPMVVVMAVVMAVMVVVDMLLRVGLAFPFLLQYYCQICICRFFFFRGGDGMLVLFYLSFSLQIFSPYAFGFFVLLIRKSECGQC